MRRESGFEGIDCVNTMEGLLSTGFCRRLPARLVPASMALVLGACASAVPDRARVAAPEPAVAVDEAGEGSCRPTDATELVKVDLDGALSRLGGGHHGEALLETDLSVGLAADSLRYEASYSLERGDVLSVIEADTGRTAAPTRLTGQSIGQRLELDLPELAGSPLSLGFDNKFSSAWLVSGYSESRHSTADLHWSPGPAAVDVEWSGTRLPFDASTALACDLRSTIRVPTHEGSGHSEGVSLTGGKCSIAARDGPFADVTTRTFGLHYEWKHPGRASTAELKVIDPAWDRYDVQWNADPGYELGLSHRRDFGSLSARAVVLLRQASIWDGAAPPGELRTASDSSWATTTSLTWKLPHASVTANWARGEDPLWFTPEIGERRDRFGLALNLSQWVRTLLPDASPKFAMNWNWSRRYRPEQDADGANSVSLDVGMMF